MLSRISWKMVNMALTETDACISEWSRYADLWVPSIPATIGCGVFNRCSVSSTLGAVNRQGCGGGVQGGWNEVEEERRWRGLRRLERCTRDILKLEYGGVRSGLSGAWVQGATEVPELPNEGGRRNRGGGANGDHSEGVRMPESTRGSVTGALKARHSVLEHGLAASCESVEDDGGIVASGASQSGIIGITHLCNHSLVASLVQLDSSRCLTALENQHHMHAARPGLPHRSRSVPPKLRGSMERAAYDLAAALSNLNSDLNIARDSHFVVLQPSLSPLTGHAVITATRPAPSTWGYLRGPRARASLTAGRRASLPFLTSKIVPQDRVNVSLGFVPDEDVFPRGVEARRMCPHDRFFSSQKSDPYSTHASCSQLKLTLPSWS
ncbi:hypothetical protein FB45DRAFT_999560 [Roridomyces roridus]|uniref:Uncharacterized protein n=1 Tax=Roridomyces roridus TaxID=1738132 RepID=A0AAD7CBV5_9AGAR|nr:hypothetical protein FB45DRAFT_999560 [Roridomyces roridus]